jgi:hypothetical protein
MKQSAKIFGELQTALTRIRELNAEAGANRPIVRQSSLSPAEHRENEVRASKLDQLLAEIRKAEAEATSIRKRYSEAMAEEQAPPPPAGPSEALTKLYDRRDFLQRQLDLSREARAENALAAMEGGKQARGALDKAFDQHAIGIIELSNLNLAIEQAEARDIEQRRQGIEADAEQKFQAGLAAAEPLVEWAFEVDRLLAGLAAHFAKLPDLKRTLAKSGAIVDTGKTNRIYISAAHDRAAKNAGLHRIFSIDATVAAAPLGEAYRSLLKAAVRRPDIFGRKVA